MLNLTLACAEYDRSAPLQEGRIEPTGIRLTVLTLPVEEIFYRMITYREFDAAELSLASYTAALRHDPAPFVALPVFPSRSFRHGCVFVHRGAGIQEPTDLAGRRVGTPEYEMTAAVWLRGILAEHHGLDFRAPRYRTGGLEDPGRTAKSELTLPAGVEVEPIPPETSLSELLAAGAIDALYTARAPSCFVAGHPDVTRLFPDYVAREAGYFQRTGIFPIMHVVALRREVYEEHPWVARELMKAFDRARAHALARLGETVAPPVMLPWLSSHLEETRRCLGDDYWPYGIEPNRVTLSTFLRYAHEQGIAPRALAAEDLFAPETRTSVRI